MATWIVHLRLAESLLKLIPGLEAEKFAVGSIAPDSGVPDEKWENFDPPPWVTHFGVQGSAQHELADLEFYRRYLLPLRGKEERALFSFRLGYFFHLITDNLWSREIGRPTLEKYREQFAANKDFIWEVKKDWYGLDFIYLRDHPDCLFWRIFLDSRSDTGGPGTGEPGTGGLEFLPAGAVRRNVEYIQNYYHHTDEKAQQAYNRAYIYLSQTEMDSFVDKTTQQLLRIYNSLWIRGAAAEGASALTLIAKE